MFVETAINGRAEALITFNVDDYKISDGRKARLGIRIRRPGEFLRGLEWRPSATTLSAFRLPPSLMKEVKDLAEQDETSVNQFIVLAVAERVGALKARAYFVRRATRAVPGDFARVLAKAGSEPPREGDEQPEGWLEESKERRG
jgi:hypothetical protein